jgi:ABC-type Fe3+/spermidine/putrescine transport system ATPase subunit
MSQLLLKGIKKHYKTGDFTISVDHLELKDGELMALVGPSGCGKTTLLKLIAGLLRPDQGELILGSQSITAVSIEQRGFGMVFQQPLLFPHMTVEENVAFGLKMHGIPKTERSEKARDMLTAVGLPDFGTRYPSELSGGQQQRVSLARALVVNPHLLLMDEPLSALDPEIRGEMRELIKRMHRQHQVTILFVTHDREEAFTLADRIAVMKEGEILQVGTPQEMYGHPIHPDVALFLGARNVIYGKRMGTDFIAKDFKVKGLFSQEEKDQCGWLVIRPEILDAAKDPAVCTEEKFTFEGVIEEAVFRQGFYDLKVKAGNGELYALVKQGFDEPLRIGQSILLTCPIRHLRFIPDHVFPVKGAV